MTVYYLLTLLLVLQVVGAQRDRNASWTAGSRDMLMAGMSQNQSQSQLIQRQGWAEALSVAGQKVCYSYSGEKCANETDGHCRERIICDHSDQQLCYVLFRKDKDNRTVISKGGCWVGSTDNCHARDVCIERNEKPKSNYFFCCCYGDLCNGQADHVPQVDHKPEVPVVEPADQNLRFSASFSLLSLCVLSAFVFILLVLAKRFCYRKRPHFDAVSQKEDALPIPESVVTHGMGKIHSLESKAQGKFGSVFKARVGNGDERYVAVKVFTSRDYASWEQECRVYRLPQMKHDNILTFLGSEKKVEPTQVCYWLVTEYLEHGSLHDYLKSRIVTFSQMLHIAEGIACGLSRLHDQLPARAGEDSKPTVAHRDFKSKNVLLKSDLTACIADFGLALIFDQHQGPIEALGQVGTRRYMAPEVLEGAISFYRDSLLRIDMYACGLVFWELMSRCSDQDGAVSEYKQPFEAEVGLNPTLEEMQETVCQQKRRPMIRESWKQHPGLSLLCETIDDMWDQDAEARISASCVQERISEIRSRTSLNNAFSYLPDSGDGQRHNVCATEPHPPHQQPQQQQQQHQHLPVQPSQRYDQNVTISNPVRPHVFHAAYFNNRSTCASDSPLLKETST